MNSQPTTQAQQPQPQKQQPLSWDAIGKLTKEEHARRREEIQRWMGAHIKAGQVRD